MKPGNRGLVALAMCLALSLWACEPAPAAPATTPPTPAASPEPHTIPSPLARANQERVPPPSPTVTPTETAVPVAPTPTEALDPSLVAQYAPWSLAHTVAWSPGGDLLAVAAGDAVYLYDGSSLQERGQLEVGAWGVGLAFSPLAPELLAVAGRDGALQLWDTTQLERRALQAAHARGANSVAFSPDGNMLASTGNDAMVRLWLVNALLTGQPVEPQAVMIGGAVAVPAIRYSPDGSLIASIDLKVIRLRDPLTQRLVRTLRSGDSMFTLAFSPDGQWLAAGTLGNQVRLWDVPSGEEILLLSASAGQADADRAFVWSLDFHPDGSLLAAGSSAGTVTLWSLPAGDMVKVIPAHTRAVSGLAFAPSGQHLATCGLDAVLRIWPVP